MKNNEKQWKTIKNNDKQWKPIKKQWITMKYIENTDSRQGNTDF